jgi:hypothetical protein
MNASLTAHQAAAEIVALINARPISPTREEIAAIVAKAFVGNVLDRNEDLAKWTAVVDAWLNVDTACLEDDHPQHAEADAAHEALCAATTAIWAKPVRSFDDVIIALRRRRVLECVTGLLGYLVYPNDVIARHMQNDSPASTRRASPT